MHRWFRHGGDAAENHAGSGCSNQESGQCTAGVALLTRASTKHSLPCVASFFQNGARGFQRIHDELAGGRGGHGSRDNSSDSNDRQGIQKLLLNAIAGLLASLA